MAAVSEQAKAKQREYNRLYARKYRAQNADKLRAYRKQWLEEHPGKQAEYMARHWEKIAQEKEQ